MVEDGSKPLVEWQRRAALGRALGVAIGMASLLWLLWGGLVPAALPLDAPAAASRYRCDGDLLVARIENGAVDALAVPNTIAGTLPGAFVVIDWRDLHLQLPRTNNAGPPSFTDGRWWWSLEDPERPDLRLRRGDQVRFACEVLDGDAPDSGSSD
ncbi:conserved hypothetical protein [Cyanobium sp. PCC 7001]|uniref:hypothetical protein n=1 Tax=Cyanobium sp. PCC 7001 TaxID=180281 RepID=UPI0001805281|nr:hypothetical protein [Cyanobium sp. PCC 7001]EDY39648.1 conserved hypothetical protein [Cyanobium sp. PCC 7001]